MKITKVKLYTPTDMNVFHQGYLPWSSPRCWVDNIRNFFRNFKYGWQRATRGYSDRDTWNIDMWHSNIMANMLYYFRDHTHGYPANTTEDEWRAILTEMAENFWRSNEENDAFETDVDFICDEAFDDEDWNYEEAKPCAETRIKRSRLLAEARSSELNKAITLLKQWYFNLWD